MVFLCVLSGPSVRPVDDPAGTGAVIRENILLESILLESMRARISEGLGMGKKKKKT